MGGGGAIEQEVGWCFFQKNDGPQTPIYLVSPSETNHHTHLCCEILFFSGMGKNSKLIKRTVVVRLGRFLLFD